MFPLDETQYELNHVVGSSDSALVYHARCVSNGKTLCVKRVDLETSPVNVDSIRRQTAFWSKSSNPNIVQYFGSFSAGSSLWLLTEYMGGGSISELLKFGYSHGIRDEPLIATILYSVLSALDFLHDHHEIHRNVRASNILVNDRGAIVSPEYGHTAAGLLSDAFGVEVVFSSIAGCNTVGSVCRATNRGCVCHMDTSDEELDLIKDVLGVEAVRTSVNHGSRMVGAGIVANSKGAVVGDETTPIEMGRIEEGLALY